MEAIVGRGSLGKLAEVLAHMPAGDILLVTRERLMKRYGERIHTLCGVRTVRTCTDFHPNPSAEEIHALIAQHGEWTPAVVIAIGGGSAIDFAKGYRHYRGIAAPLIAVPTTAGTGSEATQFAVVYVEGEKTSLDAPSILPDVAIVDSGFLAGSPRYLKACTAMDALCQAIESAWALGGTAESRRHAFEAIETVLPAIRPFVNSEDTAAADAMARGAFLAGKAINISRTTAAHALSYSITSWYGIPHGHAVALSMADLFEANAAISPQNAQPKADVQLVQANIAKTCTLLGLESAGQFRDFWHTLMGDLGLEWRFGPLGITDKAGLISSVNLQRLGNNPRDITGVLPGFWQEV